MSARPAIVDRLTYSIVHQHRSRLDDDGYATFSKSVRILVTASFLSPALAQQIRCDPELRPVAHSTYRYRLRGNRCEGIYTEKVGQDTFALYP